MLSVKGIKESDFGTEGLALAYYVTGIFDTIFDLVRFSFLKIVIVNQYLWDCIPNIPFVKQDKICVVSYSKLINAKQFNKNIVKNKLE